MDSDHSKRTTLVHSAPPQRGPTWALFTDMDGTLLGAENFDLGDNLEVLAGLQARGIPVILTTSKTASELLQLREEYDLRVPALVENGGGFLAATATAAQASPGVYSVDRLRDELPAGLTPLEDLPIEKVQAILGLSESAAHQALNRQFSLPVLPEFNAVIPAHLRVDRGGRIGNLAAATHSKARAIKAWLPEFGATYAAALGDAPNDLEMLQHADWAGIVHNPKSFHLLRGLKPDFVSTQPAPQGWQQAVEAFLSDTGLLKA